MSPNEQNEQDSAQEQRSRRELEEHASKRGEQGIAFLPPEIRSESDPFAEQDPRPGQTETEKPLNIQASDTSDKKPGKSTKSSKS